MRFRARITGLLITSLLVTGCINLGAAPGDIIAPDELEGGVKNLVIYRRPAFFLDNKRVFLTLDGIDIAKIKVNEYIEVGLGEGHHVLGARCSTSERPLTREWRMVEHDIAITDTAQMRFVELGPCLFTEETPEVAERQIDNYSHRPLKDSVRVRLREWAEAYNRRIDERAK